MRSLAGESNHEESLPEPDPGASRLARERRRTSHHLRGHSILHINNVKNFALQSQGCRGCLASALPSRGIPAVQAGLLYAASVLEPEGTPAPGACEPRPPFAPPSEPVRDAQKPSQFPRVLVLEEFTRDEQRKVAIQEDVRVQGETLGAGASLELHAILWKQLDHGKGR